MQQRRRPSLEDTLLVWGFLLSFAGLFGAACYEAFKIVAVIPAAFQSSPAVMRYPMTASDDDFPPNQSGRTRLTAEQRAQLAARAAQQQR
jgi:hypothetical protein